MTLRQMARVSLLLSLCSSADAVRSTVHRRTGPLVAAHRNVQHYFKINNLAAHVGKSAVSQDPVASRLDTARALEVISHVSRRDLRKEREHLVDLGLGHRPTTARAGVSARRRIRRGRSEEPAAEEEDDTEGELATGRRGLSEQSHGIMKKK
jgi:hypothetical protein